MKNRLFRRVAAGALLVSAACASGAQRTDTAATAPSPGAVAAPGANLLYVTNQGEATVSVIDAERRELVGTVDLQALGFSANAKPHHVVVEPGGAYWYVSLIGDNVVVKLDRQNRVVGRAPFEVAGLMALNPASDRLVVGRSMSAVNPPKRIGVIDREDMSIEEIDVFFPRPHALVFHPSGTVYSASMGVNQFAAIDVADETLELVNVTGPQHAFMQFALSPDARTLVVSTELTGRLMVFDVADPMAPRQLREIDIGPMLFDPVFTPDGRYVYVPSKGGEFVAKVDARTWEVVGRIEGGDAFAQPHGVAFSPDGRWLFVTNNNQRVTHTMTGGEHAGHAPAGPVRNEGRGWVTVIDTRTDTVERIIPVGRNATGIGVPPVTAR